MTSCRRAAPTTFLIPTSFIRFNDLAVERLTVMINDGKGGFSWQESKKTGLNLRGVLRDIALIKNAKGTFLLFLQNNETPLLYKLHDFSKIK